MNHIVNPSLAGTKVRDDIFIVTVTGHRPQSVDYSFDPFDHNWNRKTTEAWDAIRDHMAGYCDSAQILLRTGLALGWDQAMITSTTTGTLLTMTDSGPATIHGFVPGDLAHQCFKWTESGQYNYLWCLQRCHTVHFTPHHHRSYTSTLMQRNIIMLDGPTDHVAEEYAGPADLVVAFYDGRPDGGTAHTLRQAFDRKIPFVTITP